MCHRPDDPAACAAAPEPALCLKKVPLKVILAKGFGDRK